MELPKRATHAEVMHFLAEIIVNGTDHSARELAEMEDIAGHWPNQSSIGCIVVPIMFLVTLEVQIPRYSGLVLSEICDVMLYLNGVMEKMLIPGIKSRA